MQQYVNKVQALLARFREWSITHIPRVENVKADALGNLGSSNEMIGSDSGTVVQLLHSVLDADGYCEVNTTNLVWDWRNEFIEYLRHGKLPEDPKASRVLRTKVARYCLIGGQLYRRSFVGTKAGYDRILLASDGTRRKDVHSEMRQMHQPAELLHLVEADPNQKIGEHEVTDFLWEHIICRLRIPKEIACYNGPQFIGSKVTKFLKDLKIKRITSSPYHPSANGQAKLTNKVIIQNLKKRLEAARGKCLEELPGVLWVYWTTTKSSTGETPFSLVYSAESLFLMEVRELTLRFSRTNEEANNKALLVKLNLLDECRDMAHVRIVAQKQRMG
ncbi:uncharacterized protein [Nicotiana tomentosiformis]|uniref:uncharacterized protein n=1 Tax=Nicotiana tomentosiformis TaxID=4098 RepID=UPI00388CDD0C